MAERKFSKKTRETLAKKGKTGLPDGRYPVPDKAHAANAKARASQQLAKGNLTPAQKAAIDAKANAVLNKGKKKKK